MLSKIANIVKSFFLFIFTPLLLLFLYTWVTVTWVYSSGERAGYVQKLSEKGFMCKTYEGELILVTMPGTQAEKFYFTVENQKIATKINETIGKRVRLIYEQHKGIPTSCFGETQYFVQDVIVIDEK